MLRDQLLVLLDHDEDLTDLLLTELEVHGEEAAWTEDSLMDICLKPVLMGIAGWEESRVSMVAWELLDLLQKHGDLDAEEASNDDDDDENLLDMDQCEMCERRMPLTFHHLFPRKLHKKLASATSSESDGIPKELLRTVGIMICRPCHSMLHRTFDHDRLAGELNNLEAIMGRPEIQKWVQWAAKQRSYPKDHTIKGLKYRR